MLTRLLSFPGARAITRLHVAPGALDRLGRFVRRASGARAVALVSDERVAALYADRSLRSLRKAGVDASLVTIPHGERSKRAATVERLWSAFAALGLGRRDAVVALGGGVVGDLAGFAAASWLRGVAWIGVPSTVIAQVDSAIGGKTGIDLAEGKNLAGAFHQPAGVLVDPLLLQTLPSRERRAGLAEVVKMGMACDRALFAWVERQARRWPPERRPRWPPRCRAHWRSRHVWCAPTSASARADLAQRSISGTRSATRWKPRTAIAACCTARRWRSACAWPRRCPSGPPVSTRRSERVWIECSIASPFRGACPPRHSPTCWPRCAPTRSGSRAARAWRTARGGRHRASTNGTVSRARCGGC